MDSESKRIGRRYGWNMRSPCTGYLKLEMKHKGMIVDTLPAIQSVIIITGNCQQLQNNKVPQ